MLFVDQETRQFHMETGLPLMAYSAQANGFFSGRYKRSDLGVSDSPVLKWYGTEENFNRLERAERLAQELGCTPNQVALAYLIAQPFPVFPVIFCRTIEQLRDSCGAAHVKLTEEQVRYLETGG
jgi:aryl-alcohol dehydrogenase-like predicted oxidoreductase